ncbi:hypothetical protein [Rubrivirga sp. IMCC43871]|uniref:hypothetical protein n=1 Tax=Rubrivirga sp. IMCC43871 TaxID=3391575 RepID=UPI00398FE814
MPVPSDFALRLSSDNGSLPLDYQEAVILTLDASGGGTIEERRGDERSTPTSLPIGPDALAALHADLVALGLFSTAAA